jgi:hypothetical protein
MTKSDIAACLTNYADICQDADILAAYFENGNCFYYEVPENAYESEFIHVYPGVENGVMKLFVIPSQFDKEVYEQTIQHHVQVCTLMWNLRNKDRITASEARYQIDLWANDNPQWLTHKVSSEYGVFKAFQIPIQDFEEPLVEIYFGLRPNGEYGIAYDADLIVTNREGRITHFDDFSQPVPPYGAAASSSDFYLLEM